MLEDVLKCVLSLATFCNYFQFKIKFDSKDDAVRYAEKNSIKYTLSEPKERKIKPKAYADNFSFNRKETWTH